MSVYYVRSTDGNDADGGTTWALAKATVAGALALAVAGDRIWVSQAHNEITTSSVTLTGPVTSGNLVEVFCGSDATEPPTARTTGAKITVNAGAQNINLVGHLHLYGIELNAGSGAASGSNIQATGAAFRIKLENCLLALRGTNTGSRLQFGSSGSASDVLIQLVNTDVLLSHSAQAFQIGGRMEWYGGAIQAGVAPTALFKPNVAQTIVAEVVGVDLSLIAGAGVGLFGTAAGKGGDIIFRDCKVATTLVVMAAGYNYGPGQVRVVLDNCNADQEIYRYLFEGEVFREITVVKSGGASDGTAWAYKLVANANARVHTPLYSPEILLWNSGTGAAKNLAVDVLHDSLTALTNAEAWVEVQYLAGAVADNKASFASDRVADTVQAAAAQTTSAATWTTSGLTNPNKQKLDVTITPGQPGWFRLRVALARASSTLFVDPKVTVT